MMAIIVGPRQLAAQIGLKITECTYMFKSHRLLELRTVGAHAQYFKLGFIVHYIYTLFMIKQERRGHFLFK